MCREHERGELDRASDRVLTARSHVERESHVLSVEQGVGQRFDEDARDVPGRRCGEHRERRLARVAHALPRIVATSRDH